MTKVIVATFKSSPDQEMRALTDAEHEAIARAAPAQRGRVIDSLLPELTGPQKLDELRAVLGGTTDEHAEPGTRAHPS